MISYSLLSLEIKLHIFFKFYDNSTDITEEISTLCHRSTATHKYYNKTSSMSESNRYKVLGIIRNWKYYLY